MTNATQPFHLLVIAVAGWLNRQQQAFTVYLIEDNRYKITVYCVTGHY